MKSSMRLLASAGLLCGVSLSASAQNYILRIEGGPSEVDVTHGPVTITLDVIGDAEEGLGTHMLWGSFALDVDAVSSVSNIAWTHADWSEINIDHGYGGNGLHNGVEFGQAEGHGWVPRSGSELGQRIGSFQITLAQDTALGMLDINLLSVARFAFSTIDVDSGQSYYSTPETLVLEGFMTSVVPAPASMSVLALGGMTILRRRR